MVRVGQRWEGRGHTCMYTESSVRKVTLKSTFSGTSPPHPFVLASTVSAGPVLVTRNHRDDSSRPCQGTAALATA